MGKALIEVLSEASEHTDQPHSTSRSAELDANQLRAGLENSLFGQIDPDYFLKAALALTELPVGDVILRPHPSGATRFPVLNTPEGISAELWIGAPPPEHYKSAMSYVINCEPPEGEYFVEGAIRFRCKAQVTVWTDVDGRAKYFGVLTEMGVSGETLRLGLELDRVPTGLHYTFDVDNPLEVAGQQNGMINGGPGPWKDTSLIIAGDIPRKDDIELLNIGMESAYKNR